MAIALSGIELHNFAIALFLLGVGRNFLFTGSTTLSLTTYAPEERNQAQAALNFLLFAVMAISSLGPRTRKHGELEDKLTFLKAFVRKRCNLVAALVIGAFNEDVQSARVGAGFHDGGSLPGWNCRCPAARAQRR